MKKKFLTLIMIIMLLSLPVACVNDTAPTQPQKTDIVNAAGVTAQPEETETDAANPVTVGGRTFSVEEINAGIRDTLNSLWYLHGDDSTSKYISQNKDLLFGKDIEYDLYYSENIGFYPPMIHVVITNILHPLSTEEEPRSYTFALCITEGGVESDFYTENSFSKEYAYEYFKEMIYLGHYTMRIDEVTKPQYEEMDSEWVESTKRGIQKYMDANFDKILEPGNYYVYVKKFFKGDTDSIIFFEHGNGNIYSAYYLFVHSTGEGYPDLNRLELYEYANSESFKKYFEKIKSDPAVSLEYSVKKQ